MIEGGDARHLAGPLRARPGEVIDVVDPAGFRLRVRLDAVAKERVEGEVVESAPHQPEPELRVTVALAMLPAAALEEALARCTELGAAGFVLVQAERSVARGAKPERWGTICREAAMLAGRLQVPEVRGPLPLAGALAGLPGAVLLDRGAPTRLAEARLQSPAALVVGPEGGWTERELAAVPRTASLGPRNLRAENAAAAALAVALSLSGDL